ncbi:MAG: PKD domain-containing protein [Bacteroidales bacterium]|nr:PKD domain-containing protein [Bacteroidales bacterium]
MKKIKFFTHLLAGSLILAFSLNINAQISEGGTPQSFLEKNISDNFKTIELQKPDMNKIRLEDEEKLRTGSINPPRMGVAVPVNLDMYNSGTWTEIPDKGRVLRLKFIVEDALALGVYFDNFWLPRGSKLFVYNEDKKHLIGAFTNNNNDESALFSTEFIQGETVTLEYFEPIGITQKAVLKISQLAYAYRDIKFSLFDDDKGGAWWCMINVACEEGDDWENQINGAARISILKPGGYYWCSGSLINNTSHDRTPYFLTASHCGEGATTSHLNQWVFYFKYQANTCQGTYSSYLTITGASLKAWDHFTVAGQIDDSDFYLVKLNSTPPVSYDPYYCGWDRRDIPGDSGVSIHHPAGDIKKISTYHNMISSSMWTGLPTHWRLIWSETANGTSIVQGGSSGSPVFNQDKRIIGDLTGGYEYNSCTNPSPAFYGKFYWSWDKTGNSAPYRLKDWLDPTNTGEEYINGVSWEVIPPVSNFEADTTIIPQGDSIDFTDLSTGDPYIWEWIFEGAVPDTSYLQNPTGIIYSDTGDFNVQLTVTNPDGIDVMVKEDYIHVNYVAPPVCDFVADVTTILPGETIQFTDLSIGADSWYWTFQGGNPYHSDEQNPLVQFNVEGVYDIKLITYNGGGSDTLIKEDYITVIWVGISEDLLKKEVKIYPNPTTGVCKLELGNIQFENVTVRVFNSIGNLISENTDIKNSTLDIDLSGQSRGVYYISVEVDGVAVNKRISLVR